MKTLNELVRPNILALKPYSCARDEFKGEASVYLDANENPLNAPLNRYPDPLQTAVKQKIARLKGVRPEQIMLGNGSDEPIDLIIRIFCEPKVDNVVAIAPTYGMYQVCADVNNVEYRAALLNDDFSLNADRLLAAVDDNTKVIFLCSPNNPTSNALCRAEVAKVLDGFGGMVVIDEAYADFSCGESWLGELDSRPNMIVLQTFSKAWGMAAARCGMAFADEAVIAYFNKVKYPYNVNLLTQQTVSEALDHAERKDAWVAMLLEQRGVLARRMQALPIVEKVFPSDANFLLVRVADADRVYGELVRRGIIVRNRNSVVLCRGCIRFTVGTAEENTALIAALQQITIN